MIRFDLDAMQLVSVHLDSSLAALKLIDNFIGAGSIFTRSPSLNAAFAQYKSFFNGQSGSVFNVMEILRSDIMWLKEMFSNHVRAFGLQDQLAAASFDQMNSFAEYHREYVRIPQPSRDVATIDNLLYTPPVPVAEASTPLAALIAMFEDRDASPMQASRDWQVAGAQLADSMNALRSASMELAGSAQGYSFDNARIAIDSVVRTGSTVGANAQIMSTALLQFPAVRISNLNALYALQASTASIPEQAARLSAEQAAVVTFTSSHLQPSLELLHPPVANLGIPVVGHTGGGSVESSTTSTSSAPTTFHQPVGGVIDVKVQPAMNVGDPAHAAARSVAALTNTAHTSVASAATAAPHAPYAASSPASGASTDVVSLHPTVKTSTAAALGDPANMTAAQVGAAVVADQRNVQTIPQASLSGGRASARTLGRYGGFHAGRRGPVVPKLPAHTSPLGSAPGYGGGNPGSRTPLAAGSATAFKGTTGIVGEAHEPAGGSGALVKGGNFGTHAGQIQAGASHSMQAASVGSPQGTRAGARSAQAITPGRGSFQKKKPVIFGKAAWAPAVSDYFKRQFLGQKQRTVKEVIR